MKYGTLKSQLDILIQKRNNAWLTVLALLIICCIQSIGLLYLGHLAHEGRTIERPLGLGSTFWVSNHTVSANYLASMGEFVLQLYLNTTPSTIVPQQQNLLTYVAPESFDAVKRTLLLMQAQMKADDLTSTFLMDEPEVDTNHLTVKISGILVLSVGGSPTLKTPKLFILTFRYDYGRLELTALTEEKTA